MTAPPDNVGWLVEQPDRSLRARGTPERAEREKAYLKSGLTHCPNPQRAAVLAAC